QIAWEWIDRPRWRTALAGFFALTLVAGAAIRARKITWNYEPSRSSDYALRDVGRRIDVTGVAVYGVHDAMCGNYFYLRKNVPLMTESEPEIQAFLADERGGGGRVNYLVTYPREVGSFSAMRPEQVGRAGVLAIYRVTRDR